MHQDLPQLPEGAALESPSSPTPPPPIEKDSFRSTSPPQSRPLPPPKERRRSSRGSALQAMSPSKQNVPAAPSVRYPTRRSRRHQHPFINHLVSIKQWFLDSAKRARSPGSKSSASTLKPPLEKSPVNSRPSPSNANVQQQNSSVFAQPPSSPSLTPYHRITNPRHRLSLSPSPLTPHSSYRRSSTGLRGRKSTSSSVSSIRSMHHAHTHSKASSTSSNSNSVRSSALPPTRRPSRSPHNSIKVLPSTPTTSTFGSNVRLARSSVHNEAVFSSSMPTSPGPVFARRKKTPFRGPLLNLSTGTGTTSTGIGTGTGGRSSSGGGAGGAARRDSSVGASRSGSVAGRQSGEIIEEEDEDEIEEVDVFSPVPAEAEEIIWEAGCLEGKKTWTE